MLVEDCKASRAPVRDAEPHFPVFPEFKRASYAARYDLLCKKLVQEKSVHKFNLHAVTAQRGG